MNGPVGGWIDYDYALVRVVPHVHLETFVNVGVVLHAPAARFLGLCLTTDLAALATRYPTLDVDHVARVLAAYARVCAGGPEAGPIGALQASERFHWLVAPRSAVVQTSAVHGGRTRDPTAALERLAAACRAP